MHKNYYIYIITNIKNGTLYVGFTNNLKRRIYEHKHGLIDGFSKKYGIHKLVYFEHTGDVNVAISREKRIKKWNRKWKIRLIEEKNPKWNDLYDVI